MRLGAPSIAGIVMAACWFCCDASAIAESHYIRQDARNTGVIIFIHGLLGDAKTTWTNSRTGAYWPELITKDAAFDGFDVYVYEYPSPRLANSYSPDEVADNMRLRFDNDGASKHQSIVFLTHSLGGIVTRAFLMKYRQTALRVKLIYFFSTPTTGSDIARLGALISKNPQFNKVRPMTSDSYLADLQRQWLAAKFPFPSYCAYEKQPTLGQLVVEQQSATNLCNQRLDPIDANHVEIVKPEDVSSVSYIAFRAAFNEVVSHPTSKARPKHQQQVARSEGGSGGNGGTVNTHAKGGEGGGGPNGGGRARDAGSDSSQNQVSAPNGIAISGGVVNNPTVINTGPPPAVPNPVVPEISITTQEGLAPSDFPTLVVSSEMMEHLRRHVLTIKNTNTIDLGDFVMRFQLPEPVFGDLRIEDRPAGIEITWHACRVAFALSGNGASTTPLPGGGTQITTGSTPGSTAVFRSNQEVCSEKMDNEKLRPTGIYELRIERLPAVTLIRLAFLTSNGREGQRYLMFSGFGDSDPTALSYFGDGRFQYSSGGHIETRDVLVPLHFDRRLRTIRSSPSSGERGEWTLMILHMN